MSSDDGPDAAPDLHGAAVLLRHLHHQLPGRPARLLDHDEHLDDRPAVHHPPNRRADTTTGAGRRESCALTLRPAEGGADRATGGSARAAAEAPGGGNGKGNGASPRPTGRRSPPAPRQRAAAGGTPRRGRQAEAQAQRAAAELAAQEKKRSAAQVGISARLAAASRSVRARPTLLRPCKKPRRAMPPAPRGGDAPGPASAARGMIRRRWRRFRQTPLGAGWRAARGGRGRP